MKRRTLMYSIAVFALGMWIVVFILWYRAASEPESFENIDFSKIPDVSYCDLRNDPKKYSGRMVRMKYGHLHWFQHGYYLEDPDCAGDEDPHLIDNGWTAIGFFKDEEVFETFWPGLFSRSLDSVEIVAVGEFIYKRPDGIFDVIHDRTAYHFEIYSVEFVSPDYK